MLLVKKFQIFLYLDLVKVRLEIMLNNFEEKKKPIYTIKRTIFDSPENRIFPKSQKSYFSKGVNPWFWSKNTFLF